MADEKNGAKLVVRRMYRTSKDIAWYTTTDEQKAAVSAATKKEHRSLTTRRHFNNGKKLYYIKFFPRAELYDAYAADANMKAINDARKAHNTEKGIKENEIVIDMPNFNM